MKNEIRSYRISPTENKLFILDINGDYTFKYDFYHKIDFGTWSDYLFFNFKQEKILVMHSSNFNSALKLNRYEVAKFYIIEDLPCSIVFPRHLLNNYTFEQDFKTQYATYLLDRIINE